MKFFIASRHANATPVQFLTDNLVSLGHEVYPRVNGGEPRKIFEHELTGLEEVDTIILLLPAGKTSHINAGIAYGFGKHLVLIGNPETEESQYFIFNEKYPSIEAYIQTLRT